MKKKRYSFYIPIPTPAGLEKLNLVGLVPGVRASTTGMPGGVWEARQISFEADNKEALRAVSAFLRYPGAQVVTPWPQSYLKLPDGTIVPKDP
jgi:hypothetical protein